MAKRRRAVVLGGCGFIGHHLANRLSAEGQAVTVIDYRAPEYPLGEHVRVVELDLRSAPVDLLACLCGVHDLATALHRADDVYQLAADMGGMGFIESHERDILTNNTIINYHCLNAAVRARVKRYFFASSACVYRAMKPGEVLEEADAFPAMPDNEYGWEKLYAERMALAAARHNDMQVRIARFQNCYGPEGTWTGGREKAPAAMCRKVAESAAGGTIEVWGDGTAVRSYIYIDDLVNGVIALMNSDETRPTNIGSDEYVTVDDLVWEVAEVAGRRVHIRHTPGPVGVRHRRLSHERMKGLGWECRTSLREGLAQTYAWIAHVDPDAKPAATP